MSPDKPAGLRPRMGLWLGLGIFLLLMILPTPAGMPLHAHRTAAVTLLMITWWISEALPIFATALIPLALFPLMGILDAASAAAPYADHNIFLFFGGFCIALSMEKWNLHRRIALFIVSRVGSRPRQLIFGFMVASAGVSMWVSNSATAMMMMPIGLAIVAQINPDRSPSPFGAALMLAIAYGASIGGMGTLIGTPPNLVFAGQLKQLFPGAGPIGFLQWMMAAMPLVALLLVFGWAYLAFAIFRPSGPVRMERDLVRRELMSLGPMNRGERWTMAVFILTCVAWVWRQDIQIGTVTIPGWTGFLDSGRYVQDSTVAMVAALALFVLPAPQQGSRFVLDWSGVSRMPWGVLLLFGGGFSLAEAFVRSGLADWIGGLFLHFQSAPTSALVFGTCIVTMAITEMTSNTATATMVLPIVASAAISLGIHPLMLMIPATWSASCAFMLPVSTPPNAIVFGSGQLTIPQMAKTGLLLNIVAAVLITVLMYFVVAPMLGFDPESIPAWAITPPAAP